MKLVLCYTTDKARVWARWNHSFDVHLSALGPVSCLFPHPESPRGALVRRLGSWQPVCLHPEFPQGSLWGWLLWLDGCDILCLLIRQATFFIHKFFLSCHKIWNLFHSLSQYCHTSSASYFIFSGSIRDYFLSTVLDKRRLRHKSHLEET